MARLRPDTHIPTTESGAPSSAPEDASRASWRAFLVGLLIIALVVGAIMGVIRFAVLPHQDAEGEAQFVRAQSTISALQTQSALTPRPTAIPTLAPEALSTSAPATNLAPAPLSTTGAAGATPVSVAPLTAATAPEVTATSAPGATAASGPAVTTSASRATSASTPALAATSVPAQVATEQPPVATTPAASGSADDERIPLAVQGDVDPALVAELEHAYWLYWQAQAQAYATLDVAPVREVGDDTEVNGTAKLIEQLRAEGHAGVLDVQHHAQLVSATDALAIIADDEESHSYYVNLETGQPEEPKPPVTESKIERRFEKFGADWKVTGSQPYE